MILDEDLAELYVVEVKRLNEQVRRNLGRFPADFMFQLTDQEFADLKSQFATSSSWGGRRTPPYAFSEQGVAMLSSVLHSPRAVQVNIEIKIEDIWTPSGQQKLVGGVFVIIEKMNQSFPTPAPSDKYTPPDA